MNVMQIAARMAVGGSLLLGGALGSGAHAADDAANPSLTDEASLALANATSIVEKAKDKGALWTTATGALTLAQDAAKQKDSAAVVRHAAVASEQASLGMAQLEYPLMGN